MRRQNTKPIETPFGTFYAGISDTEDDKGVTFFAETESGEFTVNGVTYRGSLYFERYSHNGELFLSGQHVSRVEDFGSRMSDSARSKLASALLPAIIEMSKDGAAIEARKIATKQSSFGYAVAEAQRALDKANAIAAELRAMGQECEKVEITYVRVPVIRDAQVVGS